MADYLGVLGTLIPFENISSQDVSYGDPFEVQEARNASWAFVKNPLPGMTPRKWSLNILADNNHMGALAGFVNGAFGWQTLNYVSETAQLTNALTPAQSLLQGVGNGSPMLTPEGTASFSVVGGALTVVASRLPVIPGKPFTASMWVMGTTTLAPSVEVLFYTSGGAGITTRRGVGVLQDTPQKVSYSGLVPANAGYALFRVRDFVQAAMPALTYTDKPVPWDIGGASTSVLMTDLKAGSTLRERGGCTGNLWREANVTIEEII